ncbi:MAG: exodeoxyribonuclease VII large subunit [Solirubrobacteraceae bacterium]
MFYERLQSDVLTVSEYSARLSRALREVGSAVIEGEVQKVHVTPRGMLFFDITDGESLLSCKVFPREAARLEHKPKQGDLVQIHVDRPDLYAERGSLNLIVSQVSLAGEGELLRRRAELIGSLTFEGLCDPARRRPLPRFPRAVGVIAGQSSDGMSDVIRALADRWPAVHVITCASLVQGKAAPRQLIDALARLQDHPLVDVIVIARGGGSVQDLACFDDERLCRAVFACEVPVVCAIGHTDNNPVCNHVAWPAFTPSRSAELVVPSAVELRLDISSARGRLGAVARRLGLAAERVGACAERLDCASVLEAGAARLRECAAALIGALNEYLVAHERGLVYAHGALTTVPHHASRELAGERETLATAGIALDRTGEHLAGLAREVPELGARVRQGTRRQLSDHTRDYGRALGRLMHEARAGADRRESRSRELVDRESALLVERTRRRLDDMRRDTAHEAAIIAAQDFRRRGWLLASTASGDPARSTADLTVGERIHLHVHDGRVRAVVEDIDHHTGSTML